MGEWLTPEHIERLTGRKRASLQCNALASMGIPFKPAADGRPLVDAALYFSTGQARKKAGPNWSALRGKVA